MAATASVILTARSRLPLDAEQVVQGIDRFLRGWAGYFRYGNSTRMFDQDQNLRGLPARTARGQTPQAVTPLRLKAGNVAGNRPWDVSWRHRVVSTYGRLRRRPPPAGQPGRDQARSGRG